ncbi:MAG TPA: efflux RND transporter periplasmic adaptor subunit [Bacteroidales bacterium]|nr:efflux RND transporter periplasmic adaptor subunit [Bacteroidales bacterium]
MNYTTSKLQSFFHVIGIALILAVLTSCGEHKNANSCDYVKYVKTAWVHQDSLPEQKQFPATVKENQKINLAFRVAGPIRKILVKEGDYVKKGQLIAEMDSRDYEVQKAAAQAQTEQLRSEYARVEQLHQRNSVSDNDYEKMKAGKEMAEANLKNANDQLNDTRLYAPFTGYVSEVMFDDGAMVNHGTPIATLVDVSKLRVELNVPPSMFLKRDAITKIECLQEDIPGKTFAFTMDNYSINANNNGLYTIYLHHEPEANSLLSPGMNVSVNVYYAVPYTSQVSLPASAVFEKDNQNYVWLVENNTIHSRKIVLSKQIRDGHLQVSEGLKAGDQVVIGGLNLLSENDTVEVVAPASKSNVGNLL